MDKDTEARLKDAMPENREWTSSIGVYCDPDGDEDCVFARGPIPFPQTREQAKLDAEFIKHAPADIQRLLKEKKKLESDNFNAYAIMILLCKALADSEKERFQEAKEDALPQAYAWMDEWEKHNADKEEA